MAGGHRQHHGHRAPAARVPGALARPGAASTPALQARRQAARRPPPPSRAPSPPHPAPAPSTPPASQVWSQPFFFYLESNQARWWRAAAGRPPPTAFRGWWFRAWMRPLYVGIITLLTIIFPFFSCAHTRPEGWGRACAGSEGRSGVAPSPMPAVPSRPLTVPSHCAHLPALSPPQTSSALWAPWGSGPPPFSTQSSCGEGRQSCSRRAPLRHPALPPVKLPAPPRTPLSIAAGSSCSSPRPARSFGCRPSTCSAWSAPPSRWWGRCNRSWCPSTPGASCATDQAAATAARSSRGPPRVAQPTIKCVLLSVLTASVDAVNPPPWRLRARPAARHGAVPARLPISPERTHLTCLNHHSFASPIPHFTPVFPPPPFFPKRIKITHSNELSILL